MHRALSSVGDRHKVTQSRQLLIQLLIGFLLVFQAAHQPAAHARNFCLIERKILLFCHFDRDRGKIRQIRMTAEASAADSDTAEYFCFVPHTDLAKFYPGLKNGCQVFYQKSEIDSAVSCKIKQHFIIVKSILRIDQLHVQLMLPYLLPADFKSFSFFLPVLIFPLIIFGSGRTDHLLQRMYHFLVLHFLRTQNYPAVFHAPRGFHDHMVIHFNIKILRIKVIYLTYIPKSDTNNFCHLYSILKHLYLSLKVKNRSSSASSGLTFALSLTFVLSIASSIFSRFS